MEGVKIFTSNTDKVISSCRSRADQLKGVEHDLKKGLAGLAQFLFGDVVRACVKNKLRFDSG